MHEFDDMDDDDARGLLAVITDGIPWVSSWRCGTFRRASRQRTGSGSASSMQRLISPSQFTRWDGTRGHELL